MGKIELKIETYFQILVVFVIGILLFPSCSRIGSGLNTRLLQTSHEKIHLSLQTDIRVILSVSKQWHELNLQFEDFKRRGHWKERGYFDATETEELEALLFRFLTYHSALWDIVHTPAGINGKLAGIQKSSDISTIIKFLERYSEITLIKNSAHLVLIFSDDPIAIKQLNQHYYRTEILFGTFDKLRVDLTNQENLHEIAQAKDWFDQIISEKDSGLIRYGDKNSDFNDLVKQFSNLQSKTERNLNQVTKVYPSNKMMIIKEEKDILDQHKMMYKMQSEVFLKVSRLKSPLTHPIHFTKNQKKKLYEKLEPGDLIITYTSGYVSDVFIPGDFKHGITYVGSPEQRKALGITPSVLGDKNNQLQKDLKRNLNQNFLKNGKNFDIIEAVAEGVIMNNLNHILDTHINRMVVLRPRLSPEERAKFVGEVFSYLGDEYDFRFDFSDPTFQVCTELIYRAIQEKGGIEFKLTNRGGHPTLSADDMVNYYLVSKPQKFDFLLYAEEDPNGNSHVAKLWVDPLGEIRLAELMKK